MAKKKPPAALLRALGEPAAAGALVDLCFDLVIDQPLGRYVALDRVLEHVDRALSEAHIEKTLREHLRPALDREIERARARGDRLGDWLTEEARDAYREVAGQPVQLSQRFLEGLIEQEAVRETLRALLQESLDRFVSSLAPKGSAGGRLADRLRRGAAGLGKGLLGSLGGQLEAQLRRAATSFIDSSLSAMLGRLLQELSRPETGERLGRMNRVGFDRALGLRTVTVLEALRRLPLDDLDRVLPGLIGHNLARPEVREGIVDEVRAVLAVEGDRSLRSLLEELGAVSAWRAEVQSVAVPLLAELAVGEGFGAWLAAI